MKILFHNIYDSLNQNNNLFETKNAIIGDDLLLPFHKIDELGKSMGWNIGTCSKVKMEEADAIVFIDYPRKDDLVFQYALSNNIKSYLITLESPIVRPEVFDIALHEPFECVFTWSDKLVKQNENKYVKINYSYEIKSEFSNIDRNKNFVIIAGNKKSSTPGELYSERNKCIKWFERNAANDLDLYGFNWDLKAFETTNAFNVTLNKLNHRFRVLKNDYKTYKGTIERKYDILPRYKFCICFENVYGHEGYITEKIFDCFFSGTIPVYKGAPNIEQYIPQSCFIDYNQFSNISEVYEKLMNMTDEIIGGYQQSIRKFLQSKMAEQFSVEIFASTIINTISK